MIQEHQKFAVPVRCTNSNCKFNGVVLIAKETSKDSSVKKEECPFCHSAGCLELIRF